MMEVKFGSGEGITISIKPETSESSLPQYREPSTCEACGASFTCGASLSGCWCSEIELSEETRAHLRSRFERCLCRACLEKFAEGEKE